MCVSCRYSASPSSPAAVVVVVVASPVVVFIVPLVPSISTGPNVCPASADTLSTDSLDPVSALVSHHDTYTLFSPAATISAFCDSVSLELLRLILSPNV